jgi:hypothetical protein
MSSPIISDSSSFATCNSCRIGVKSLLSAVIERAKEMAGRLRYQDPKLQMTKAKPRNRRWYFTARVDVIGKEGQVKRIEKDFHLGMVREMGSMDQMGHTTQRVNNMYLIADDEDFKRRAEAEARLMEAVLFGGNGGRA